MTARAAAAGLLATALAAALCVARASAEDPPDAAKIADLVGKLSAADAAARDAAADSLAQIGAPAVPALVAVLSDAAGPRVEAARTLGAIGAGALDALPGLTALVGDAASKAQAESADAVGRIAAGAAKAAQIKPVKLTPPEAAVEAGLDWLARHQSLDGHWSAAGFDERCYGKTKCDGKGDADHDAGVTGLAVLAFLGAGETHVRGPHADKIAAALKWLRGAQDAEGCFGPRLSIKSVYDHGCAALAMAEAHRRSGTRGLADPVRRAVAFVHAARDPKASWHYGMPPDGGDTSATLWMTRTLGAAADAGLEVDPKDLDGALAWVESMTDEKTGRTGYQQKGGTSSRLNTVMGQFPGDQTEALTAGALLVRQICGRTRDKDAAIALGETLLAKRPPSRTSADLYYWMHGAEALSRLGGPTWDAWRKALVETLVPMQRPAKADCARGSWDPVDPWGEAGGRVFTTCAALVSLEHATDDPARRPSMSATVRAAATALEKAAKSSDSALRKSARRAADALRAAYR